MAEKQRSELKAGIFVLAALAAALGVVLWMGAADLLKGQVRQVVFCVDQAEGSAGLAVGSEVVVAGKPVGRIRQIKLSPGGRALYVARIEHPDVDLRSDGSAKVIAGLLGNNVVAVTHFGSASAPPADERNPVHLSGGLEQAMTNLAAAAENMRQITELAKRELDAAAAGATVFRVHALLNELRDSAANMLRFTESLWRQADPAAKGSLLAKLHDSADKLANVTASLSYQTDAAVADSAVAKAQGILDDVRAMTADAGPRLQRTLQAMQDMAEHLQAYSSKDLAELLATMRRTNDKVLSIATNFEEVSQGGKELLAVNRKQIDEMVHNLTLVSADLKATAKEVRRAPWKLLYEPRPQEVRSQNIYDAARAFSSGAEQLDQALSKLNSLAALKGDAITSQDPELQKVREELRNSFEHFSKVEQALWRELSK